jgi:hypothetical protein
MAKKNIHSKHHLLFYMAKHHGKKKKEIHIHDEYETGDELFKIDIHDEFIDEDIQKLELKLEEIKKNVKEKLQKN